MKTKIWELEQGAGAGSRSQEPELGASSWEPAPEPAKWEPEPEPDFGRLHIPARSILFHFHNGCRNCLHEKFIIIILQHYLIVANTVVNFDNIDWIFIINLSNSRPTYILSKKNHPPSYQNTQFTSTTTYLCYF